MDQRLRSLERAAITGDQAARASLVHALLGLNNLELLLSSLFRIEGVTSFEGLIRSNHPALMRIIQDIYPSQTISREVITEIRRAAFQIMTETGVWHGFRPLDKEDIAFFNAALAHNFLFPWSPHQSREDWRDEQYETVYTYHTGSVPSQLFTQQQRENHPIYVGISCQFEVPGPIFGVTWLDYNEFMPHGDGLPIEDARLSGTPGQILGSYRVLERTEIITNDPDVLYGYVFANIPEMQLHIFEVNHG